MVSAIIDRMAPAATASVAATTSGPSLPIGTQPEPDSGRLEDGFGSRLEGGAALKWAERAGGLGSVSKDPRARQAPCIRRPWRPFPVPAAPGGERGVGGGTGGGDHRPDRGPAVRDRSAAPADDQ